MKRADRRAQLRKQQPAQQSTSITFADSYHNAAARLGAYSSNLASQGTYLTQYLSHNRQLVQNTYTGSWVAAKAVDVYADDLVKKGIELTGPIEPDRIERILHEFSRLALWLQLADGVRWSRLFGGAAVIILIAGQDLSTPLRPETVGKGQLAGLYAMDRWVIAPSQTEFVQELGPNLGKPAYYTVQPGSTVLSSAKIHHSRIIKLDGQPVPEFRRQAEQGWGVSIYERMWQNILAFDSTTAAVAQLIYQARLRTMKIEGLRRTIAAGDEAVAGLEAAMSFIRKMQSSESMTVIDAEDEMQVDTYAFTGLDNVLEALGDQISGATGLPRTKLFGQSPAGMNATGESDLETYHSEISQQQESKLRTPLTTLIDLTHRSLFGVAPPEGTSFNFRPLKEMSDETKANIASTVVTTITTALDHGVIDRPTAMREFRQSSKITGIGTNVTDEAIEEAEQEPPPIPEAEEQEQPVNQEPASDAAE